MTVQPFKIINVFFGQIAGGEWSEKSNVHLNGVRGLPVVWSPAPGLLAAAYVVEMGAHLGASSLGARDQNAQDIGPRWWVAEW